MEYRISALKEAVSALENALDCRDTEEVDVTTRLISSMVLEIKNDFWTKHVDTEGVVIQPIRSEKRECRELNTLDFYYKPMLFGNVYEGNGIELYARDRTEDLVKAGAIEAHNRFWQSHEIIFGTVYGSVPLELISETAGTLLKKFGWKRSAVTVMEYARSLSVEAIRAHAEAHFRHYILLRETETGAIMVLKYHY